jgi:hypothetical protein
MEKARLSANFFPTERYLIGTAFQGLDLRMNAQLITRAENGDFHPARTDINTKRLMFKT